MPGSSAAQTLITAMLTPALLILASGSLIAAALVRLGRVVDRLRALGSASAVTYTGDELTRHERRARLALAAVAAYFAAIALFVAAGGAIAVDRMTNGQLTWLPLSLTLGGMTLIVVGVGAMWLECRDSAGLIAADVVRLRGRLAAR